MKSIIYTPVLLGLFLFIACGGNNKKEGDVKKAKAAVWVHNIEIRYAKLKMAKDSIDTLAIYTNKLLVFVKIKGMGKVVKVHKNNFPENTETTYNFIKDKKGHVIYAVEIPDSESGDWFITYTSYFNAKGQLFAFERQANFFNSMCTPDDGVAYENLVKYYDQKNTLIDSTYRLTGKNRKPLIKSKCTFNYNYPYLVIFNADQYLKANKIKL